MVHYMVHYIVYYIVHYIVNYIVHYTVPILRSSPACSCPLETTGKCMEPSLNVPLLPARYGVPQREKHTGGGNSSGQACSGSAGQPATCTQSIEKVTCCSPRRTWCRRSQLLVQGVATAAASGA